MKRKINSRVLVCCILLPICTFVVWMLYIGLQVEDKISINGIGFSLFMSIWIAIFSWEISQIFIILKASINNIAKYNDDFFDEIDNMRKNFKEKNDYYQKYIQKINEYYKENGKIDILVKEKNIEKLYKRADFLAVQLKWYDEFVMYFTSLIISVLAGYMNINENNSVSIILTILSSFMFVTIALLRYSTRGRNGSYKYMLDEYERDLLSEKIRILEKSLVIIKEEEQEEDFSNEELRIMLYDQQQLNESLQVTLKQNQEKMVEIISKIELLNEQFRELECKCSKFFCRKSKRRNIRR